MQCNYKVILILHVFINFEWRAYVKELLQIPDNIMIESIITIGYPDEGKKDYTKDSLQFHKVSFNTYSIKDAWR